MKKRKPPRTDSFNPEDRKRKINFKQKKQRQYEASFNPKRLGKIEDFDEFEDE
jgi:hypothetical protein